MTVAELLDRVGPLEFREWQALYKLEAEERRQREMEARATARADMNFRR
jgi:hypothetical protein